MSYSEKLRNRLQHEVAVARDITAIAGALNRHELHREKAATNYTYGSHVLVLHIALFTSVAAMSARRPKMIHARTSHFALRPENRGFHILISHTGVGFKLGYF